MFRLIASVIVMICVLGAWIISSSRNNTDALPVGNASQKMVQPPVQSKPANPEGKNFNF